MNTYDYVVVGAGSAGAVAAARLSEDPTVRVLLLEAGESDDIDRVRTPAAWPGNWGTSTDWNYITAPQEHTNNPQRWPRGKVLGGSSSINGMIWLRGWKSDFEHWVSQGAAGWSYEDVLPFFMRSEAVAGARKPGRGTAGPIKVGTASAPHPVTVAALDGALEVGHAPVDDFNVPEPVGAGLHEMSIHEGLRQSTAVGYLRPAMARPSLTVLTGARVDKLLFDGKHCVGVAYTVDGVTTTVAAYREVILCAGAVGSPQLLMLSGIGPGKDLTALGIEVIADLPGVGANLQDHLMAGVTYEASRPMPESINNHGEASVLLRSSPAALEPDLQLLFILAPFHPDTLAPVENGYTINVALLKPQSRGSITLASSDPSVAPIIDPRYLSARGDVDVLVKGLRYAREVGESGSLAAWRQREVHPGKEVLGNDALRQFVGVASDTYYHPVGTCRIGMDPMAVVDPALRVHGVTGLRVADASVMPSLAINTNATTVMIGERVADFAKHAALFV
jgi:choline dehydrogenase